MMSNRVSYLLYNVLCHGIISFYFCIYQVKTSSKKLRLHLVSQELKDKKVCMCLFICYSLCVCVWIYICIYVYVCVCTWKSSFLRTDSWKKCVCVWLYVIISKCICVWIYMCMHLCLYMYVCTYICVGRHARVGGYVFPHQVSIVLKIIWPLMYDLYWYSLFYHVIL